jgi:RNA polymerase sigma-70 factor, ECF subfamily
MNVTQLGYQRTLAATPRAQLDVAVHPDGIPETGDRDGRLVEALRRREATAAERLVATFGDRAYRLAIGITGNPQDAEEAVQDSFWNVVRRIDTFRGQSSLRSWIYRITANAAYQKCRSGAHRRNEITLDEVLPDFLEDGHHADPTTDWSTKLADPAMQRELRDVLASALDELPPHYRAAIVLRDVEGLPVAEVAETLGIAVGTAKTRAHRARLLLRKRLSMFIASPSASVAGVARKDTREGRTVERDRRRLHPKGRSRSLRVPVPA